MNEMVTYLEGVKVKLGIASDLQFSARIGVSYSLVHGFLHSGRVPGDDTCIKIAALSGDDPAQVIALAHVVKASGSSKQAWEKIFAAVNAAAVLVAFFFLSVVPCLGELTDCILCQVENKPRRTLSLAPLFIV